MMVHCMIAYSRLEIATTYLYYLLEKRVSCGEKSRKRMGEVKIEVPTIR